MPESTALRSHYVLQVAHCNHCPRLEDLDMLVREVNRIGNERARSAAPDFQSS